MQQDPGEITFAAFELLIGVWLDQRWRFSLLCHHACDAIPANGDQVVGFLDDDQPVGPLANGTPVLGALSQAWDLTRLFAASDQAPPEQVVLAGPVVNVNASINTGVLVSSGAVVAHGATCAA